MNKTKILIVDDHPLMREALRTAVEDEPDMQVVGEACDGNKAIVMARELAPDVILMDLLMPDIDGLEATVTILAHQPQIKILVLTSLSNENKVVAAVQAGRDAQVAHDPGGKGGAARADDGDLYAHHRYLTWCGISRTLPDPG